MDDEESSVWARNKFAQDGRKRQYDQSTGSHAVGCSSTCWPVNARGVNVTDCERLKKQIAVLFAEHLGIAVPSAQTDLIKEGLLDSLKFIELLVQLEQKFGARIDLNGLELDNFRSIQKIAEYLVLRYG